MKILRVLPSCEWPVPLIECPAGLFIFDGDIGFKADYFLHDAEQMEVFCADSGEIFWGGAADKKARAQLIVQPAFLEWTEGEI